MPAEPPAVPALAFAQRNGMALRFRSVEELRESYQFTNLQSFLDLYYECTASLITEQDFYELTLSYLRHAAADGVRHVGSPHGAKQECGMSLRSIQAILAQSLARST